MSSKNNSQSQQMYKKLVQLSKDNKKLLESLSSHLILQSSYLDKYIKAQPFTKNLDLQQKYENLLTESNESMLRNQILRNQLQQKKKCIESLKQQIGKYEMQNLNIDQEITRFERKIMQQEELEKQYQFELMKRNAQLKKQLQKAKDTQRSLVQQNTLYQKQSIELHLGLQNANQQLKQSQFILIKKESQQKQLLSELEQLKKQMQRKKDKMMRSYSSINQEKLKQRQRNNKTQIVKEIDEIQFMIQNFKRNSKQKGKV